MKQLQKNSRLYRFTALLMFAGIFNAAEVYAQGDLLITPKRVVFDGSKRSEELNLANIGKDTATYAISFVQYKMKEDGSFEQVPDTDTSINVATKNLRFFPRTVTLAPNEAQAVKVQLTKTNELKPGEYRSHIYFRAIPKEKPLGEPEVKNDSGISVRLIPVFGITIPTIIRIGENNATVSLTNGQFMMEKDTIPTVKATFTREGNMSVYGDITVIHTAATGVKTVVASIKGIAVYTPTPKRNFQLKLAKPAGIDYTSGTLTIVYSDQSPRPVTLAQQEIVLK